MPHPSKAHRILVSSSSARTVSRAWIWVLGAMLAKGVDSEDFGLIGKFFPNSKWSVKANEKHIFGDS